MWAQVSTPWHLQPVASWSVGWDQHKTEPFPEEFLLKPALERRLRIGQANREGLCRRGPSTCKGPEV